MRAGVDVERRTWMNWETGWSADWVGTGKIGEKRGDWKTGKPGKRSGDATSAIAVSRWRLEGGFWGSVWSSGVGTGENGR